MFIPIKLQINIQLNFLTITNHGGQSRERKKAARPEALTSPAKLRKQHRPLEDAQRKLEHRVRAMASDIHSMSTYVD